MLYTWKIDFLTPATFVAFSPRDKYIRDQFLNVGIAGNSIAMFRYFFLAEFFPQISREAFERARSIRLLTCWRRFEPNFIRLDEMRKGSTKQSFLSFFLSFFFSKKSRRDCLSTTKKSLEQWQRIANGPFLHVFRVPTCRKKHRKN